MERRRGGSERQRSWKHGANGDACFGQEEESRGWYARGPFLEILGVPGDFPI